MSKSKKIVAKNQKKIIYKEPIIKSSSKFNFTLEEVLTAALLIGVLLLIILIRNNFLNIPFERDEGSYAYAGKIILDGAIPFTDIGSQRLDGVFYSYALLVGIFGYSVKALHVAFLVINLISTIMLFFLTKKITNNFAGFAAAAFFAILSMISGLSGFTIQSEHLVALFIIAAFLCLFYFFDNKKVWLLILSGVFFSFAFQVKQTSFFYGLFAGALLIFKLYFDEKNTIKKTIILTLIFSASILFPIVIDLLIVYKNGAWADFNLWFFEIRKQYTALISFEQGLDYLKMTFSSVYKDYSFFWIISFIGPIALFFTDLSLWKKITVLGLTISGFLTVVPGYHYYGHYFLQWIPAVCISAAMFIYFVQYILKNKLNLKASATLIALALVVFPIMFNVNNLKNYYFTSNHTQILRDVYGLNPFPESKVIADKLNTMMKEEDKLAVFGTEIQMYVYTNKKSPSRFAGSGALLEFPIAQSKEWQQEFIADVEKAAPRFLVFFSHPISWMANPKTENLIFPWFDKFSAQHYKLIGFADMYGNTTNYVWEPNIDFVNNPPKSQYKIFIFERK